MDNFEFSYTMHVYSINVFSFLWRHFYFAIVFNFNFKAYGRKQRKTSSDVRVSLYYLHVSRVN